MKITDYLDKSHIYLDMTSSDKKNVLEELTVRLAASGAIRSGLAVLEALLKREGLGSTGLEKGIAVPHALTSDIAHPLIAVSVIKEGMDFESADGQPSYVVLLLLGGRQNPGIQLQVLAHICRLTKESDMVERMRSAQTAEEVYRILDHAEK